MPWATWEVYIDWLNTGTFGGTADNISAYVKEITTERGRDSQLKQQQAATAELRVINKDKRFSPQYATGPYYGSLLPKRPIRIRAIANGTTFPVFQGYVSKFVPHPNKSEQDAYIYATGVLGRLLGISIVTTLLSTATESAIIQTVVNSVQRSGETIPVSLQTGLDTYTYWWWSGDALQAVQHIAQSSRGLVKENAAGTIIFENANYRGTLVSVGTFDNEQYIEGMNYAYGDKELANRIISIGYSRVPKVGTVLHLDFGAATPMILPAGTAITFRAAWTDPMMAHNPLEFIGNGGTLIQTIVSETATSIVFTLAPASGTASDQVVTITMTGTSLPSVDQLYAQADDGTSQATYGIVTDRFDTKFLDTNTQLISRSNTLLADQKDPIPELSMTLRPATESLLETMLRLDISNKVTVKEDQTAINGDFYVEKISQRVTFAPQMHETEFVLLAI